MHNKLVIKVISGNKEGKIYEFIKQQVSIGSSENDDIQFDYLSGLQPNHATINIDGDKLTLTNNCFSSVYVNKVSRDKTELNFDDEIQFGAIGPKIQVLNPEVFVEESLSPADYAEEKKDVVSSDFEVLKADDPDVGSGKTEEILESVDNIDFEDVSVKQKNQATEIASDVDLLAGFEDFESKFKKDLEKVEKEHTRTETRQIQKEEPFEQVKEEQQGIETIKKEQKDTPEQQAPERFINTSRPAERFNAHTGTRIEYVNYGERESLAYRMSKIKDMALEEIEQDETVEPSRGNEELLPSEVAEITKEDLETTVDITVIDDNATIVEETTVTEEEVVVSPSSVSDLSISYEFTKPVGAEQKQDQNIIDSSEKPDEADKEEKQDNKQEESFDILEEKVVSEHVIKKEEFTLAHAGTLSLETIEVTVIAGGETIKRHKYILKENGRIIKETAKPMKTSTIMKKFAIVKDFHENDNPYKADYKSLEAKIDNSVDSYETTYSSSKKKKEVRNKAYDISSSSGKTLSKSTLYHQNEGFPYYEKVYKRRYKHIVDNFIKEIDRIFLGKETRSGYKEFEKTVRDKKTGLNKASQAEINQKPFTSEEATMQEVRVARNATLNYMIGGGLVSVFAYGFFMIFPCIGFFAKILTPVIVAALFVLVLNSTIAKLPEREFHSVFCGAGIILINSLIVNFLAVFFALFGGSVTTACAMSLIFGLTGFLIKLMVTTYISAKIARSEEPHIT